MKTILAAVDQSRHANAVISLAAELACLLRSDLTILSVIGSDPMKQFSIDEERSRLVSFQRELILKHFPSKGITLESSPGDGAVYRYVPAGVKIQLKILLGNPVDKICSYAEEVGANLVIVGNRGLGNIGDLVLGSVSERVVHKCSRSVLVVRGEVLDRSDREAILGTQKTRQHLGTR